MTPVSALLCVVWRAAITELPDACAASFCRRSSLADFRARGYAIQHWIDAGGRRLRLGVGSRDCGGA